MKLRHLFLGGLSQKLSEIKPPLKYDARTRSEMYQYIFCSSLTSLVKFLESCCDWLKDEQFLDGYILNWELLAEFCFNNISSRFFFAYYCKINSVQKKILIIVYFEHVHTALFHQICFMGR